MSATEYFLSRTIIQPGWVSSLSSSSLSSSSWPFSQWDNSRTLWAIKLKFCMVNSHDYLLWIRIREPISLTQTGPTSQISIFGKKFHDGLTLLIFVRFGSNFVQRSLVSLFRDSEFLKWLRPFFDQPARSTKPNQYWTMPVQIHRYPANSVVQKFLLLLATKRRYFQDGGGDSFPFF